MKSFKEFFNSSDMGAVIDESKINNYFELEKWKKAVSKHHPSAIIHSRSPVGSHAAAGTKHIARIKGKEIGRWDPKREIGTITEAIGPVTDAELKHHRDHPELDGHKQVEQHPLFKKHFKDASYKMIKSGGNYHEWKTPTDSLHYNSAPRWAEATMYHNDHKNPSDHFAIRGSGANHKEAMDDLERQIKERQK